MMEHAGNLTEFNRVIKLYWVNLNEHNYTWEACTYNMYINKKFK